MKKTYWWRMLIFLTSATVVLLAWLNDYSNILGGNFDVSLFKPIIWLSFSPLIVSPLLFFVNDIIFKKWLKFAIVWFALTTILIIFAPTTSTQIIGNPTKEDVSIWMSSFFIIISLIQIIFLSMRQKNK